MSQPIPFTLVEKYHRAIFAIDRLGENACGDRHYLRQAWQNMQLACAMKPQTDDIAGHEAEVGRIVRNMETLVNQALKHEKDVNRPIWEKQRAFLLGSLRRTHRAATLNSTEPLHFFSGSEIFDLSLKHEHFQIGYRLWQGIRAELKEALSLSQIYPEEHPAVIHLHTAIRRIINAMEASDVSQFRYYSTEKSPLRLSKEEEGRVLWEAVREEIAHVASERPVPLPMAKGTLDNEGPREETQKAVAAQVPSLAKTKQRVKRGQK